METLKSTKVSRDCTNEITIKHPKDSLLADRSHARLQSAAAKGTEVRNGDLRRSDDSFRGQNPRLTYNATESAHGSRLCATTAGLWFISPAYYGLWGCRLAFCASHSIRSTSHQENAVFTFSLLFVPFSLLASKKSSDTRKYCLLMKRNPLYFLGVFFHLLGNLGLLSTTVLLWKKIENTTFSFTRVSCC